jgi:hypothetical protein
MYIPYSFKRWNLIALPMCVRLTASSESNTAKLMACPSEIRLWKDWLLCWYLFFSLSHHLSVISHPEGLQLYELPWTQDSLWRNKGVSLQSTIRELRLPPASRESL